MGYDLRNARELSGGHGLNAAKSAAERQHAVGGIGEQATMEGGMRETIAGIERNLRLAEDNIQRAADEVFGAQPSEPLCGDVQAVQVKPPIETLLIRLYGQSDRLVGESARLNRIG